MDEPYSKADGALLESWRHLAMTARVQHPRALSSGLSFFCIRERAVGGDRSMWQAAEKIRKRGRWGRRFLTWRAVLCAGQEGQGRRQGRRRQVSEHAGEEEETDLFQVTGAFDVSVTICLSRACRIGLPSSLGKSRSRRRRRQEPSSSWAPGNGTGCPWCLECRWKLQGEVEGGGSDACDCRTCDHHQHVLPGPPCNLT